MILQAPTPPSLRLSKGRIFAAAGPHAAMNPHRALAAPPSRDSDPRDEDEDLGPWVRLPGGGLELVTEPCV